MPPTSIDNVRIAVIGLGYVGLPLALGLSRHFPVTGYDVSETRISELRDGHDRTGEIKPSDLRGAALHVTADTAELECCNVFIIAVPTPVDADNKPDLSAAISACRLAADVMSKGAVVILESTVYPGVTEGVCGPEMEKVSGLVCGKDFYLGYSPERINPGDREHTVDKIRKVVAGQTPVVAKLMSEIYGAMTTGGVFVAKDIKTAEAAKVIENAQRDINIAFINEVSMIFNRLGISTHDVLATARTKWNFLNFEPGLVGGHCIGIDPFYLAHVASELGYDPDVILSGRRINDSMAGFLAQQIDAQIRKTVSGGENARILVLGLTFKENVPDLRNSKAVDMISTLKSLGHHVDVHDAMADQDEAKEFFDLDLLPRLDGAEGYDCLVGAVPHAVYIAFSRRTLTSFLKPGGLIADLKGMWRHVEAGDGFHRWEL